MKKLIVLLSFFAAQLSFASIVVENVDQFSQIQYENPFVQGGPVVTSTNFQFTYTSCAKMPVSAFEVVVAEKSFGLNADVQKTVSVQLTEIVQDCFGPTFSRTYHVTTTEIAEGEKYILLNPSVLNLSPFVAF